MIVIRRRISSFKEDIQDIKYKNFWTSVSLKGPIPSVRNRDEARKTKSDNP